MNFLNQAGLTAGAERYGAKNTGTSETISGVAVGKKCQECGHIRADHSHTSPSLCYQGGCDCKEFTNTMDNASPSARENEGNQYTCEKCGTTWPETRDRVPGACPKCGGHPVDVFKGKGLRRIDEDNGRNNADSSALGYQATTTSTTAKGKRKIGEKFYEVGKNADGQWMVKCEDCRKTIRYTDDKQESNEGGTCDECKAKQKAVAEGRKNASPRCPKCDEECSSMSACIEHLKDEHGMSDDEVVKAMSNELDNAACAICAKEFKDWNLYKDHMMEAHKKDLMKVGNDLENTDDELHLTDWVKSNRSKFKDMDPTDIAAKAIEHGFSVSLVQKALSKIVDQWVGGDMENSVYTPPLLTLSQKVAHGQREYGAVNAAEEKCSECGLPKQMTTSSSPSGGSGGVQRKLLCGNKKCAKFGE